METIKFTGKKMIRRIQALMLTVCFCMSTVLTAQAAAASYEHDPRLNAKAMEDIRYDPNAVYGFSPREDSVRLGNFASYDYSDPEQVEKWKAERMAYHASFQEMYTRWEQMRAEGKTSEEIAKTLSPMRNELRLASYQNNPEGLAKVKASNLAAYGQEDGPTPEQLYEKYGSWDTVILKCFSSNSGMDAVLGLYDMEYDHNLMTGAIDERNEAVYTVQKGDYLCKIAYYYFGDKNRWRDIYAANRSTIRSVNLLYEGQKLRIPLGE